MTFPPPPEGDPWLPPQTLAEPSGRGLWPVLTAAIAFATFGFGVFVGSVLLDDDDRRPSRRVAPVASRLLSPSPSPSVSRPAGACAYEVTQPSAATPPLVGVRRTGVVRATIELTQGPVQIELFAGRAPCTVHSFLFLARRGFFDDTSCHRVTTRSIFILQCGDPTGTGTSGSGYTMPDENLTGARYVEGTVAMANAGPDTNSSQFFISYRDNELPPNYTVFGRITAGLDVVKRIAAKGAKGGSPDGPPAEEVGIRRVTSAG